MQQQVRRVSFLLRPETRKLSGGVAAAAGAVAAAAAAPAALVEASPQDQGCPQWVSRGYNPAEQQHAQQKQQQKQQQQQQQMHAAPDGLVKDFVSPCSYLPYLPRTNRIGAPSGGPQGGPAGGLSGGPTGGASGGPSGGASGGPSRGPSSVSVLKSECRKKEVKKDKEINKEKRMQETPDTYSYTDCKPRV